MKKASEIKFIFIFDSILEKFIRIIGIICTEEISDFYKKFLQFKSLFE